MPYQCSNMLLDRDDVMVKKSRHGEVMTDEPLTIYTLPGRAENTAV